MSESSTGMGPIGSIVGVTPFSGKSVRCYIVSEEVATTNKKAERKEARIAEFYSGPMDP